MEHHISWVISISKWSPGNVILRSCTQPSGPLELQLWVPQGQHTNQMSPAVSPDILKLICFNWNHVCWEVTGKMGIKCSTNLSYIPNYLLAWTNLLARHLNLLARHLNLLSSLLTMHGTHEPELQWLLTQNQTLQTHWNFLQFKS